MLEDLKYSAHIWNLREEIVRNLNEKAPMYALYPEVDASRSFTGLAGTYAGYKDLLETAITQNTSTSQFLGSYVGKISIRVTSINKSDEPGSLYHGSATLSFHIENATTEDSYNRPPIIGYTQWYKKHFKSANRTEGPHKTISQFFDWIEVIDF